MERFPSVVHFFLDAYPGKNEKKEKLVHQKLDVARFCLNWRELKQIVQFFSDICPGKDHKTKKVDHLELDFYRSCSIKEISPDYSVFSRCMSRKKRKNQKSGWNSIRHIRPNLKRFPTGLLSFSKYMSRKKQKNEKIKKIDHLELDFTRFGSIWRNFKRLFSFFQIYVQEKWNSEKSGSSGAILSDLTLFEEISSR